MSTQKNIFATNSHVSFEKVKLDYITHNPTLWRGRCTSSFPFSPSSFANPWIAWRKLCPGEKSHRIRDPLRVPDKNVKLLAVQTFYHGYSLQSSLLHVTVVIKQMRSSKRKSWKMTIWRLKQNQCRFFSTTYSHIISAKPVESLP